MSKPPVFLVLFDLGSSTGLGHFARMTALSAALTVKGCEVRLGLASPGVAPSGERLELVPFGEVGGAREEAAACVIDSYLMPGDVRESLAPYVAIDDLGQPGPGAVAVVNPAPGADPAAYARDARLLLGPTYALLAPEYWGSAPRPPAFPPKRILIALGSQASDEGIRAAVAGVRSCAPELEISIAGLPKESSVEGAEVLSRRPGLHTPIAAADIVLTAGGVTALEAAALGRPAIGVLTADNQRANIEGLVDAGCMIAAEPSEQSVAAAVRAYVADGAKFASAAHLGRATVDGFGALRVAAELLETSA